MNKCHTGVLLPPPINSDSKRPDVSVAFLHVNADDVIPSLQQDRHLQTPDKNQVVGRCGDNMAAPTSGPSALVLSHPEGSLFISRGSN